MLSKQYAVEFVDLSTGELIADSINTLIVPDPYGEFSERELYVIDQFIMSGRGVLVAVDGVRIGEGLVASINHLINYWAC